MACVRIDIVGAEARLEQFRSGIAFPDRPLARPEHADAGRPALLQRSARAPARRNGWRWRPAMPNGLKRAEARPALKPVYLGRGDDLYDARARLAALPARNCLIPLWDLRPQFSIAYLEDLTGEAVAMAAEQVRDDVCDLVRQARPVGRGRYRVNRDVALTQL